MTDYRGGYGILPYGHTEYGMPKSDVEARFNWSKPPDNSIHVPADIIWLTFTTYCYSSWIDLSNITVEISEDDGATFSLVYDGTAFFAPYNGGNSKVRRYDGNTIRFWIEKTTLWVLHNTVHVRFTGTDEFGQPATKVTPVIWP